MDGESRHMRCGDELECVVAVASAADDLRVALLEQSAQGVLTVLGRLADGIAKAHLRLRPRAPQRFHKRVYSLDGLSRLRDHAIPLAFRQSCEVCLAFEHK